MVEYIEKVAILSKCEEIWDNTDESTQTGVDTINAIDKITDFIEAMPTADVRLIKRGEWEEHHATYIKQLDAWFVQAKCSCCGRYSDKMDNYSQYLDLEYCSHCGADMRGERDA